MRIIEDLSSDSKPVNVAPKNNSLQAKHQIYNGEELSSVKGVISKNLYIAKLHPITGAIETPIVNYGDSIDKYFQNKRTT
jgi:hypothetical protein